jgi:uncharacterized protein YneF (UPF0154 family)
LNRRTSNDRPRYYKAADCFLHDTLLEIRNLWRSHFSIEVTSERIRQRLNDRPGFNIYDAFAACDINEDGRITKEEIRRMIESRGFYVSDREVSNLVEKFDKNKDGRISLAEFREEMLPRSPVRM